MVACMNKTLKWLLSMVHPKYHDRYTDSKFIVRKYFLTALAIISREIKDVL